MNKTVGATLLIAGCCVGAGMLGIPVVSGPAGFIPSLIFFVLAWLFMLASGLLLAKLVLSSDLPNVNVISLAEATLGKAGKFVAWILFAFLFYALMTAYVIAAGTLIADFTSLSFTLSSLLLIGAMYAVIARGVRLVDSLNRYLMLGMLAFYLLLIYYGASAVKMENLSRANVSAAWVTLPILVISFGYHNLIGSLATYLNRDKKSLYTAIALGSSIPLLIYIVWEFVILGMIPEKNMAFWTSSEQKGELVTQLLADTSGSSLVLYLAQGFAFFAIATSFLPVSFSFLDFIKDGLRKVHKNPSSKFLALFVLIPPLVLALGDPHLFLEALDFAGGYCAVGIFGILPALMALKQRSASLLWIGAVFIVSCTIIAIELAHQLGKI